jgi:hypothetical protein
MHVARTSIGQVANAHKPDAPLVWVGSGSWVTRAIT